MRKLIGIMLIAALLLTGCQMAREEDGEKTTADPLVGALITTLSAAEDWDGDRLDVKTENSHSAKPFCSRPWTTRFAFPRTIALMCKR